MNGIIDCQINNTGNSNTVIGELGKTLFSCAARAIIGVMLLLLSAPFWAAPAQAVTYTYRNDVFAYDTPSGAATSVTWHASSASPACTGYPQGDDDWADIAFPAGFKFTFGGVNYSGTRVYSNGMLAFGTDTSGYHRNYTNLTLPITAAASAYTGCTSGVPVNLMVAYWTDIVAGTANATTGASVQYELLTDPVTGQKRFVISWVNVKLYGQAARYNFQIALYDSTVGLNGNFKYQYTTGSSDGSAATVGVQLTTADYTLYSYNQTFIDPTNGTAILWYPANQLAAKGAGYNFDEAAWTGTAGEIKDNSGNNRNASKTGAAASIAAGKVCRGGSFTANTLNTTIDAVATPIVPANIGSVDFWYYSTNTWNSADTMLFDATTVAAKPFFLMKRSTGALRFVVTDSAGTVSTAETATAYTYAANTWHHVGVSWNLKPGINQTVQQIFLDGVLVNTLTTTPYRSTTSGNIATLSTLYIGDNRTSGVTPNTGTPNGANGTIDEVNIYPIDINASQAAADMALTHLCAALDHFHIVHSGSQVSCNGTVANITIEAHDVNHNLVSLAGTTMQMSTSTNHGTWSGVTTINPVTNGTPGNGSYTFSNESSIVLGLSNTFIESLNINLLSGSVTERSGAAASCVSQDYTFGTTCDANLSFIQAGFRFLDSAGKPIANQVAGTTSGTYYLQAVQNTCVSGTCTGICSSVFPAGSAVSIGLAFECQNPTTCAGKQVTLAASGTANPGLGTVAANNSGAISSTTGTYTTQSVTFNSAGPLVAIPFTLNYPDVGQIALWARYPVAGTATVWGSSESFVVKPGGFVLSNIKQTAAPNLVNPAAANATGAKFIKASEAFTVTVTATTSGGATTPNYGKEILPEGVKLTPTLVAGLGLINIPALTNGSIAGTEFGATGMVATDANGVATVTNLAWDEVGIITLTPSVLSTNYLAAGDTVGTVSVNIGRFYPDHFDTIVIPGMPCPTGLTCPTLIVANDQGFVYSGQSFTTNVYAKNAIFGDTQNYRYSATPANNFAKAVTLSAVGPSGGAAIATTAPGGTMTAVAVAALSFANGNTTGTPAAPTFTFATAPTVPTDVYVRANESAGDGVTSLRATPSSSVEGGVKVVSGRIKFSNAYGSELLPLPMTATVQYWNGMSWVSSSTDTVTTIAASAFALAFPVGTASRPNNLAACETAVSVSGSSPNFKVNLSAPGNGNNGWTDLTLNLGAVAAGNQCIVVGGMGAVSTTANRPWLQYPTGSNPTARATFGVYKGANEFIYLRENY